MQENQGKNKNKKGLNFPFHACIHAQPLKETLFLNDLIEAAHADLIGHTMEDVNPLKARALSALMELHGLDRMCKVSLLDRLIASK